MTDRFHRRTDIVQNRYFRIPKFINVDLSGIPYKELVWQDGDRLDILAEQLTGDPSNWKAIALFNDIGYFFQIQPGDIIKIPVDINLVLARI